MKIAIATDHHGVKEKAKLIKYLESLGNEMINYGPDSEESVDYPKYAFKVGESVSKGVTDCGILMCGTGIGMSIAANKVKGIRCARICTPSDAALAKEHNNANVIAFSANTPFYKIKKMVKVYLDTEVSKEERHIRRVNMINDYND